MTVPPAAVRVVRPAGEPADELRQVVAARAAAGDDRLVVVTTRGGRAHLLALVRAGAHGIVLAERADEVLEATVAVVAAGQSCLPDAAIGAVAARPLSARQRQVLALVIMGLTNREIAGRLHLGEETVKTHVAAALAKLGVRTRAEALDVVTDPRAMLATGVVGLSGRDARPADEA